MDENSVDRPIFDGYIRPVPSFGANLKRLRKRANLTQAALAEKLGVKQPSLWKLEHDRSGLPETPTLLRLANALECSIDDLLEGVDVEYERRRQRAWRNLEEKLARMGEILSQQFEACGSDATGASVGRPEPGELARTRDEVAAAAAEIFSSVARRSVSSDDSCGAGDTGMHTVAQRVEVLPLSPSMTVGTPTNVRGVQGRRVRTEVQAMDTRWIDLGARGAMLTLEQRAELEERIHEWLSELRRAKRRKRPVRSRSPA